VSSNWPPVASKLVIVTQLESMAKIESIRIREIVRPLKTVFATALGRKGYLHNVLVSAMLEDGSVWTGEIPTSFSRKDETIAVIRGALEQIRAELKGVPIETYEERIRDLRRRFPHARMTISGLEVALFRAFLKSKGASEHQCFGARLNELETDITIPFVPDVASLTTWIGYAVREGFRLFKIKVSGDVEEDKRFLSLTAGILAKAEIPFRMRLDGNQGYTVTNFFRFADWIRTKDYPIDFFEQPLPKHDLEGLRTVRKAAILPIILDESVDTVSDVARALDEEACDGVNIKIAKSGIAGSLEIANLARENRLRLMIGCMTETMTGLSAGLRLASGTGLFDYVDLDSIFFLHHRNRYEEIRISGPRFVFRQNAGREPA
jgi:L-alanine-DL-glutamate epimerase-like enolase superfamily enzyme